MVVLILAVRTSHEHRGELKTLDQGVMNNDVINRSIGALT